MAGLIIPFNNFVPRVDPSAFIAPNATLIGDVEIFDVYAGKGVPEGKKSVAISVMLQPRTQTLTDADIESVSKKIVDAVASKTGGTLRA